MSASSCNLIGWREGILISEAHQGNHQVVNEATEVVILMATCWLIQAMSTFCGIQCSAMLQRWPSVTILVLPFYFHNSVVIFGTSYASSLSGFSRPSNAPVLTKSLQLRLWQWLLSVTLYLLHIIKSQSYIKSIAEWQLVSLSMRKDNMINTWCMCMRDKYLSIKLLYAPLPRRTRGYWRRRLDLGKYTVLSMPHPPYMLIHFCSVSRDQSMQCTTSREWNP